MQTLDYMVQHQINDWLILSVRPNNRKGYVLAKCICGKVVEVRGRSIRTGVSTNCGCKKGLKLRNRQRIVGTDSAFSAVYLQYKRSSKYHNREFDLTPELFKNLTSSNCYYCNELPTNRMQKHKYIYYYNGLDRVDNTKGYVYSNVVPCCFSCNTLKGGITIKIIDKIIEFRSKKCV